MNEIQNGSVSKYLYDVSKGALLTAVAGMLTQKLSLAALMLALLIAAYTFDAAFTLEGHRS